MRLLTGHVSRQRKAKKALASAGAPRARGTSAASPLSPLLPVDQSGHPRGGDEDGCCGCCGTSSSCIGSRHKPGHHEHRYSCVYRLLRGRSARRGFVLFRRALASLIIVNIVAFVLESIPSLGASTSLWHPYFYGLEAFSSSFFLLEHIARTWTAPESKWYKKRAYRRKGCFTGACLSRLRYSVTLRGLVDLVSCLPFFIELCVRKAGGGERPR
jgi:hypothetical protein